VLEQELTLELRRKEGFFSLHLQGQKSGHFSQEFAPEVPLRDLLKAIHQYLKTIGDSEFTIHLYLQPEYLTLLRELKMRVSQQQEPPPTALLSTATLTVEGAAYVFMIARLSLEHPDAAPPRHKTQKFEVGNITPGTPLKTFYAEMSQAMKYLGSTILYVTINAALANTP
jgi:hypothetical protein